VDKPAHPPCFELVDAQAYPYMDTPPIASSVEKLVCSHISGVSLELICSAPWWKSVPYCHTLSVSKTRG